jgi:diaminopimelate decarboxylase
MSRRTEASSSAGTLDDLAGIAIPTDQLSRGRAGRLLIEQCDVVELLREFGSPLCVISERTLRANYRRLHRGLVDRWPGTFQILSASGANDSLAVRAIMHDEGAGGECVGEGGLYATFAGGADPECVVLNGSNKAYRDLCAAVELGVRINIDGQDEIWQLAEIATEVGRTARVNLRIRAIPTAVATRNSDYARTGVASTKTIREAQGGFSVKKAAGLIERIQSTAGLELEGFHHHIGRLMPELDYYRSSADGLVEAIGELHRRTGFQPRLLDIGGGLPRERDPESRLLGLNPISVEGYLDEIMDRLLAGLRAFDLPLPRLWIEPGAYLVGNAAIVLATVGEVRRDLDRVWVYVDGPVNHLMRADILPGQAHVDRARALVSVVGSLCAGSPLARGRELPELRRGDVVAFLDAGTYAETASTRLAGMPWPATVLVDADRAEVIKDRETVRDLFAHHRIPVRLRPGAHERERLAQLLTASAGGRRRATAPDTARVAVFGTGRLGAETVRAVLGSHHDLVAGVVLDLRKAGRDLGTLTTGEPLGVTTTGDLGEVLGMPELDIMLYCGMGGEVHRRVLDQCIDAGKDVITAAGLVHPATDLGADRAHELDRRAWAGGARILGAGMNPGFLLDTLPVVLATSMPDPVSVFARRVSDISRWSPGVLRGELGFGERSDEGERQPQFVGFLLQSLHLIGDALRVSFDTVTTYPSAVVTDRRVEFGGLIAEPGTVVGFDYAVVGVLSGNERVRLEWRGVLDPAGGEGLELRVNGPRGISETIHYDYDGPRETYPVTAARMVKSIAPLRLLPPGLHTADELAPAVRAPRSGGRR